MEGYFRCVKGCTLCCPGGIDLSGAKKEMPISFYTTIGDVFRSYKYNNSEKKSFSEVFKEQFRLVIHTPLNRYFNEEEKKLEAEGWIVVNLPPHDLFTILPSPRDPCYNLNSDGCRVHNSHVKYLTCALQPQETLQRVEKFRFKPSKDWKDLFICAYEKKLSSAEADKIKALKNIFEREEKITEKIFPKVTINGMSNMNKNGPVLILERMSIDLVGDEAESAEFKEIISKLEAKILKTMRDFDDEKNRWWQEDVLDTTESYFEETLVKTNIMPVCDSYVKDKD